MNQRERTVIYRNIQVHKRVHNRVKLLVTMDDHKMLGIYFHNFDSFSMDVHNVAPESKLEVFDVELFRSFLSWKQLVVLVETE